MDDYTQINVRLDPDDKRRFQKRCIDCHATMADMIRIFVRQFGQGHLAYDPDKNTLKGLTHG